MAVQDTSTVNLSLSGDGSDAAPWKLQADATVTLDALTDVSTAVATVGYVLARQADGTFSMVPPNTAGPGALSIGDGLTGDASSGNKLRVLLAAASGLVVGPTGLAMQGGGAWTTYTPVWGATSTVPTLGNGTIKGFYSQTGKQVMVSIELTIGSTSKRGVGAYTFTLPVPPATNRRQVMSAQVARYGVADYVAIGSINAGKVERVQVNTGTTAQALSHSVPATLPTGSIIFMTGCYEAA